MRNLFQFIFDYFGVFNNWPDLQKIKQNRSFSFGVNIYGKFYFNRIIQLLLPDFKDCFQNIIQWKQVILQYIGKGYYSFTVITYIISDNIILMIVGGSYKFKRAIFFLSLIHISEPTRRTP